MKKWLKQFLPLQGDILFCLASSSKSKDIEFTIINCLKKNLKISTQFSTSYCKKKTNRKETNKKIS